MNTQLEHGLDKPIGFLFDNENFKALVYDFYYTLPESDSDYAIGDIYRWIFSDAEMYGKFLQFYRSHNFTCLDEQSTNVLTKTLDILIFEKTFQEMGDRVSSEVSSILDIESNDIFQESLHSYIPGTKINFWNGLRYALYNNIPLNNHGQVLYYLEGTNVGHYVYSRELGKHHVDRSGRIISRHEYYIEREREMMDEYILNRDFIELSQLPAHQRGADYEYGFSEYCKRIGKPGDTDKLLEIRFKMALYEGLRMVNLSLKDIRRKGFGFGDLELVHDVDK